MSTAKKIPSAESFKPLINFVCQLVSKEAGIVLGEKQATMVETRIKKRMLDLKIQQPSQYIEFIKRHFLEEKEELISALTTHHTYFFREFQQVEALLKYLPAMIKQVKSEGRKEISIWSAACSRGQEVYTIAMFLDYHLKQLDSSMDFRIYGTDIDQNSVKIATNGVYHKKEIDRAPLRYLASHWARGKGKLADYVKVKKSISEKCSFGTANLVNIQGVHDKFDIIFVRNVLIYFKQDDITKITHGLANQLNNGGLIICGASESLAGHEDKLSRVAPYIYQYGSFPQDTVIEEKTVEADAPSTDTDKKLKVFCIDDSPSVLKLLKKILTEEHGFEVIGTAENGLDAQEKLRDLSPDLVTLDIHMPEMDGIQYLQANYGPSHPPVVVISSASREDSSTAMKVLSCGASDFVEKPSLANMQQRGDEIRAKLRVASSTKGSSVAISSIDNEFAKDITYPSPDGKLLLISGSLGRSQDIAELLKQIEPMKIPALIFLEGQDNLTEAFSEKISATISQPTCAYSEGKNIENGTVYVSSFNDISATLEDLNQNLKMVATVFGECSQLAQDTLAGLKQCEIMVEDLAKEEHILKNKAKYIVTPSSFSYHILELMNEFDK